MIFRRSATLLLLLVALLPSPAAAQQADDTTVETALLDILLERGIISAEEHEELLALARARVDEQRGEIDLVEARLARLRAPDVQASGGAPGKLVFKSPDGTWSLGLKGLVQARVEVDESDDDTQDDTNFSVPRARIEAYGISGTPDTTYEVELDMGTNKDADNPAEGRDAKLEKAFMNWAFSQYAAFRFGQFKVPFGREEQISTGSLQFQERSIANKEFAPSYEPGAMVHGKLLEDELTWQVAVNNGEGSTFNNTAGDTENGLREAVRVTWSPLGAVALDGPAFPTLDDGAVRVIVGAAFMHNDDSAELNTATPSSESSSRGLEAQLFAGPFSLLAEHFTRRTDAEGVPDVTDRGSTLQAGLFVFGEAWEVIARDADVNFDTEDDSHENAVGVNWYRARHAGKWMMDFSWLRNDGDTADAHRSRLMYQLLF